MQGHNKNSHLHDGAEMAARPVMTVMWLGRMRSDLFRLPLCLQGHYKNSQVRDGVMTRRDIIQTECVLAHDLQGHKTNTRLHDSFPTCRGITQTLGSIHMAKR
jgi:hypothetical protein